MTVWEKLENEECYAVALYNFAGSKDLHLPLELGELVHIVRETRHWYWGKSIRNNASGAFPKSHVALRDCVVDRCGETVVASAGGSGVVHDIAVTLREWLQQWKKLFINNDERLKFVEVSMRALLELRQQAASGALPQDQLRRVARTAVFTIDKGNRVLGMELAVRNANGQLVDPMKISMYKLNVLHEEANTKIDKNMETTPTTPPPPNPAGGRTYTIAVRVHNFVCRMTEAAELSLALHDASGAKLTEHLHLRWAAQALPTVLQVVFTDFSNDILKSEKVYLVCHVVRIGSMEAQNFDHRRSSMAAPYMSPAEGTAPPMRRPFGIACADVKRHLVVNDPDKHVQVPFYAVEKDNLDTLLKKVMTNRDIKDAKHTQGLWVSLHILEGDLKQIREENPHIFVGNVYVARKMGFPEVIMPGDARNDLYVTVGGGAFSKGGGKSSERNIELVARVVDQHGRRIPGAISVGAGVPLANEYTSIVYYHDDKPRWQETFKVFLNVDQFKESHLVFLCRHRSSNEAKDRAERHFALAYLRLMQRDGTSTPDTTHNLCVYKIDHKRTTAVNDVETEACATCLALPAERDELPAQAERGLTRGPLSLVHRDSLSVVTRLCSTKLTQREEILGVLKWNSQHAEGEKALLKALKRLLQVPSDELVKFLQDILDALFSILTQLSEDKAEFTDDSYCVLVLECLLRVISLVADHKYQHFQPVLHLYINTNFCDALAYEKLLAVMVWVIRSADSSEAAMKRLLTCMKCIESLVRLVVRSRQLRAAMADDGGDRFRTQFDELMEALVWLMKCGDRALTCQGAALKYLPHAAPHALAVYPADDLCAYIVGALDALPLSRLSKQRMLALAELVRGPLCTAPRARPLLLTHLAKTLKHLLKDKAEWDRELANKSRSVGKAARLLGADTARLHDHTHHQQIVELCVETLGEVMSLLARDDVGPVDGDRGDLAKRLLPTVLKTTADMVKEMKGDDGTSSEDALVRRMVAVLLDMVRQMDEDHYTGVVKALEAEHAGGPGSLVSEALELLLALLRRTAFSVHWADMLHAQHRVMLHALKLLSTTVLERLNAIDERETEGSSAVHAQCRLWFQTAAALATAPSLQLETLPTARRQRQAALHGDLRRAAAHTMADMWDNFGDHKRSFIPWLVGPFLETSFIRDEEVRNTTIPIFFDMMQTEYMHSTASGEPMENCLKDLESELIDKLDVLIERGYGDTAWRARFVLLCGKLCNLAGGALRATAGALVAAAARQLDVLLQYRCASQRYAAPHRMHLTTRVLHFYEQIEKPHMYIRYVHKLAKMYEASQQWAEAGLTLRLHAKLLEWTHNPVPPRLRHHAGPRGDRLTHRELKESLYLEIANLLNQGRQWEIAVEIIQELVRVYEEEALGYAPLVELHQQLASLYVCMLRTPRSPPGYFRVLYHGHGFPPLLTVEHGFVYRGLEYEQLQGFIERLLDEWPDAEVLSKLDPPGTEITESDGQYLQINAVEPVLSDKLKRLSGKPVAEQILQYYTYNNVDTFIFSRPVHKPEESLNGSNDDLSSHNEFASMWLERTELVISDKLPGILRWFPVVRQRTYWVSPVEAAVEQLKNTNRTLKSLILEAKAPEASLQPLTMRLTGILDPAVQGGIVNYEKAFLTPAYAAKHPENAQLLSDLKELIVDQVPLLKHGLDVHAQRAPTELEELHAHLLKCFRRVQQHVHQRYGRKSYEIEVDSPEVQLRMPLRDAHSDSGTSNNRLSDVSTGTDSSVKSPGRFFGPLSRNSSGGVVSYFNTLQNSPRRKNKKNSRKSEMCSPSSGSQWYTSHRAYNGTTTPAATVTTPAVSADPTSPPPLKELRQELVTARPLRAEAGRERRESQRASLLSAPSSNRNSIGTTDSNQEDDEPPPLPKKYNPRSMDLDSENNNFESNPLPPRNNYDTVFPPRGSFLYNSMIQRRNTTATDKAPTPPPKKRNAQS